MAMSFSSPFLEAFEILPWDNFDDEASGSVFKVKRKIGVECPVDGVDICGNHLIVKVVNLPSGPGVAMAKKLREVELLEETRIEDENVIKIFGSWEERPPLGFEYPSRPPVNQRGARLLFILMEYCDLFTLRRWLGWPQGKRSWADLLNIFLQVTKGLVAIHEKGIIHRDLKPSNVGLTCQLTDERVIAKLIDFGLATKQSDEITPEVGTHLYRSPENHRGRVYDKKTDVYALGIILCQMIASLMAKNATFAQLEEEFRQFVVAEMTSSLSPSLFNATSYLKKYGITTKEEEQVSEMINLAKEMTCHLPNQRFSSSQVLKRIREFSPEAETHVVSIYNYLEEVKERQVYLPLSNCNEMRLIKTSRLNNLTHLTLKGIQMTKQLLLETVTECSVLLHLSLSLLISDLRHDELLQMGSISLPRLQTFRFRIHTLSGNDTKTDPEVAVDPFGVPRMLSLMFFGPLSQIWENKMRVKISYEKQHLVNIDAGTKLLFFLDRIIEGFEFLEILNKVKFQNVKLTLLQGKNDSDILDLNEFWLDENKAAVYDLHLKLPNLDLMEGRLFQGFSCLTELRVRLIHKLPFKTVQISILPGTLVMLTLAGIRVSIDGMSETTRRNLWYLNLYHCEVPGAFYDKYSEIFQVEYLFVQYFVRESEVSVLPGISFVETVFNTSNWRSMMFGPFDWTETPENTEFREELLSDFSLTEDSEMLKDKWLTLELINGKAEATLYDLCQRDEFIEAEGDALFLTDTMSLSADSDDNDEEAQQRVLHFMEDRRRVKIVHVGTQQLDNSLDENYTFKGTLTYPAIHEHNWHSKVIFEKFGGISKDKPKLRHIQLKDCSLSSSLPIQLRGCGNLESLEMDMVEWEFESGKKMTSKFPRLTKYNVNLYGMIFDNEDLSEYFTFESFDQLWFFRSGSQRIKGLWGKGIECRVSVQGTLYFQLDDKSLTLQFLPDVNRILSLLQLNESLLTLNLQCCLFKFLHEDLPSSITKLSLRFVEATFREVCELAVQLKSLEMLIFEGCGDYDDVDFICFETLPPVKHLTLCNVSLSGTFTKMNVPLESLTFNRVKDNTEGGNGRCLNDTFPKFLLKTLIFADDQTTRTFNYGTLYSLLMSEDVCLSDVVFIEYDRSVDSEAPENDIRQLSLCESFLASDRIFGKSFRVQLEEKSSKKWRAEEIFPDESEDPLLDGYKETLPYFPKDDKECRKTNLESLKKREFIPHQNLTLDAQNAQCD